MILWNSFIHSQLSGRTINMMYRYHNVIEEETLAVVLYGIFLMTDIQFQQVHLALNKPQLSFTTNLIAGNT